MGKQKKPVGRHHRRPRSHGGSDEPKNISLVPVHQHRAYHCIFANYLPEQVAQILTDVWIDPDYIMIAVHKEKGLSMKQLCSLLKP